LNEADMWTCNGLIKVILMCLENMNHEFINQVKYPVISMVKNHFYWTLYVLCNQL